MKKDLLKSIATTIFLTAIFQFSGCVSQQANSESSAIANKPTNTGSESATPVNKPTNIAEENFAKEWKSKFESTTAELERNRRLWQESKIVNYDFVIAKYAGGVTNEWNRLRVLIKIREGEKISIEKVEKDKDYVIHSRTDGFEDFDTIDKLFIYIRKELNGGKIVDAEYDSKFGYPKRVSVTFYSVYNHNSRTIEISKLEIVK